MLDLLEDIHRAIDAKAHLLALMGAQAGGQPERHAARQGNGNA
jgi:hypothetical protein